MLFLLLQCIVPTVKLLYLSNLISFSSAALRFPSTLIKISISWLHRGYTLLIKERTRFATLFPPRPSLIFNVIYEMGGRQRTPRHYKSGRTPRERKKGDFPANINCFSEKIKK